MERSITLPIFVDLSLSLFGFLLLVSLFFHHGNAGKHVTASESGSVVGAKVLH